MASAGLLSPTAYADGSVVLGGGVGITVNGTNCTLATIGHDNTGELVGFTAASCGGPGSQVTAADGGTPVGSVVAADDQLKYAVIKFDPAKAIPTANFAGFAINGIGPDPDFRQPACTDGAVTGIQCGLITTMPGPGPGRNMNGCLFQPGDEGRPVTSDNLLIGVARNGWWSARARGSHRSRPDLLPAISHTTVCYGPLAAYTSQTRTCYSFVCTLRFATA